MVWLWTWGIITAIALVLEFWVSKLVSIWFAAGGLITLLVVALVPELHILWQSLIFVASSALLLICLRKICLKVLTTAEKGSN